MQLTKTKEEWKSFLEDTKSGFTRNEQITLSEWALGAGACLGDFNVVHRSGGCLMTMNDYGVFEVFLPNCGWFFRTLRHTQQGDLKLKARNLLTRSRDKICCSGTR